jgi:hypothetical protein
MDIKDQITNILHKKSKEHVMKIRHTSTPMNEWDPKHLLYSYPTLFPYGLFGIMDHRQTELSYREHVLYLLKLSSERFRCHRSFMFICFNILQRAEARKRIRLLVKKKDFVSFPLIVDKITQKDIEDELEQMRQHPSTIKNNNIQHLLSKIQSSTANVQGSKAALKHRRNDLTAYIIQFGVPQFYITLNPADVHNPLLLFIGSEQITQEWLNRSAYKRANYLRRHPFVQALFFDRMIEAFFAYILSTTKHVKVMDY